MATPAIGRYPGALAVSPSRTRQTPRPTNLFKQALAQGARVLLSGARTATQMVGLPILSAAVTAGQPATNAASAPLSDTPTANGAPLEDALSQRANDDLKLLSLQSRIHEHNRQITMLSNVIKARHDTAKAAIGNMRA